MSVDYTQIKINEININVVYEYEPPEPATGYRGSIDIISAEDSNGHDVLDSVGEDEIKKVLTFDV